MVFKGRQQTHHLNLQAKAGMAVEMEEVTKILAMAAVMVTRAAGLSKTLKT